MLRILKGVEQVLKPTGTAAIVIGDVADPGKDPVSLAAKVWDDVGGQTGLRLVQLIGDQIAVEKKVSRIWGDTKGQATAKDCVLVLTHKDAEAAEWAEEIDWDEPYKDGGPDAAHGWLRSRQ